MRRAFSVLLGLSAVLVLCFSISVPLMAADDGLLVARGEELFQSKEGLNVKIACILCHKGAKALDPAKINALGDDLPNVINKYLVEKAKGTAIAADSEEMRALVAYLRSDRLGSSS